jgi:mitochondrial fission protein ELM1
MDWGSALDAFGSYKDKEFEKAIEKLSTKVGIRRSARNKGNNERIQTMAEAIKKEKNDLSGDICSTSSSTSQLVFVAAACKISLGNSPDKIEVAINTFHANELARIFSMLRIRGWKRIQITT